MSRNLGWPERHTLRPDDLRRLADAIEEKQRQSPLPMPWAVDVVAPEQVWEQYDVFVACEVGR